MHQERIINNERGAIMLLGVFLAIFGLAMLYTMMGISEAVLFRARMQDGADASALSAATMQARSMNLMVLLNIVMAALLAVLVALKLVEAIALAASIVAAAVAYPTFGASLALVPPFEGIRQEVRALHDQLEPPITNAIEAVKSLSDEIPKIAPVTAGVIARGSAAPPVQDVHTSIAGELPVEDDEYEQLCKEAGEIPGELATATLPLPKGKVLENFVTNPLTKAMGELAATFSSWFCGNDGEGGSPPPHNLEQAVWYPLPKLPDGCGADTERLADEDWVGLASETNEKCDAAYFSEEAAAPAEGTGECLSQCELNGLYETKAQEARTICEPGQGGFSRWAYQLREATVDYQWTGSQWQRLEPEYLSTVMVVDSPIPPCGAGVIQGLVDPTEYNPVARLPKQPERLVPVCSDEVAPLLPVQARGENVGRRVSSKYREVPHMFGCSREEVIPVEVEGASPEESSKRAPKRVKSGLQMGDEDFQVRILVQGRPSLSKAERMVRLALWGQSERATGLEPLMRHAGLHVAQAEYFYDDGAIKEAWMWNMNWNARLVRFRSTEEGLKPFRAECQSTVSPALGGQNAPALLGQSDCARFLDQVEAFGPLITH